MTARDEITAAHDDVARTRAQMASTAAEIEARLAGRMDAVKAKLDVMQMIRDNPWSSHLSRLSYRQMERSVSANEVL